MESGAPSPKDGWPSWTQAVVSAWRGDDPPRTHVRLDDGEIVFGPPSPSNGPVGPSRVAGALATFRRRPFRRCRDARPHRWGETIRLIGCDHPAVWLDGVIREYVDIEWVHDAALGTNVDPQAFPSGVELCLTGGPVEMCLPIATPWIRSIGTTCALA